MTEEAKFRMLFENENYPKLKKTTAAIEVQLGANNMTFLQITNHLATKVSKFENKQAKFREVTSVKVGKPEYNVKGSTNGGVHMPDGSLFTGFLSECEGSFREQI